MDTLHCTIFDARRNGHTTASTLSSPIVWSVRLLLSASDVDVGGFLVRDHDGVAASLCDVCFFRRLRLAVSCLGFEVTSVTTVRSRLASVDLHRLFS